MTWKRVVVSVGAMLLGLMVQGSLSAAPGQTKNVIVLSRDASVLETLAAREVRRYVYLTSHELLPIVEVATSVPDGGDAIVVARKDRAIVGALASDDQVKRAIAALGAEQFILLMGQSAQRKVTLIVGGDALGTLYGAYRFAESLGVRFYLHGDVIPDAAGQPLALKEAGKPLFELRGIQPFHDFPEGPDWWDLDDYKAIIAQLPKLRMNFFGLHTYPEGGPNAEPTVWIGLPDDIGKDGQVRFGYPSSWQNTLRGNWGYAAKKTSEFSCGAAQLFERDDFGAKAMNDLCPQPQTAEASNEMFERAATLLQGAFVYARALGVKTCVGTETPLVVPRLVRERLKEKGKTTDTATIGELYEGIFRRIAQTYPLDYYWFWTPENWTWQGVTTATVQRTIADIQAAIAAAKKVNAPFQLATCGWVLGPQYDRALFDNVLPREIAVSCINRQVGKEPVDEGFARVKGRGKWAIPWLEDDPALTVPQLWAGRMRRDAADALAYGCNGLMGIHWRTRILAPNVSALAWAAWDQSGWGKTREEVSGPVGGQVSAFPKNKIVGTEDAPLYQTVRYNLSAYRLRVPNGTYGVTLKFCEPHYSAKGKRVFGVSLQGKRVIAKLDIFGEVGQNKALDYTFENVAVGDGMLNIEFRPQVEFPSIAAIAVEGKGMRLKINCGGPAYKDYVADPEPAPRDLPATNFYRDWTRCQFGAEAAEPIAQIFERLDGKLPCPATWVGGPGGIKPDPQPWEKVKPQYDFVDELATLRPKVNGKGNLERLDYWLDNFRYLRAVARLNCTWALYDKAMAKVKAAKDAQARKQLAKAEALPLRKEMVALVGEVYQYLLATVSNPGELGTIANWEQHLLPGLLEKPGAELAQAMGEPLPAEAQLAKTYRGPMRVIVPTVRSSVMTGEALTVKVIVLAEKPPQEMALYWRPMGAGEYAKVPLVHVARAVYSVKMPSSASKATDLEYYIKAVSDRDETAYFPATAPTLNQTVVVMPRG